MRSINSVPSSVLDPDPGEVTVQWGKWTCHQRYFRVLRAGMGELQGIGGLKEEADKAWVRENFQEEGMRETRPEG